MRQVFPTLKKARDVSLPTATYLRGHSREAQGHCCRSPVSASLGLQLLTNSLAVHTIVLLGLTPPGFPIDALLSGESHHKKKRLAAKIDRLPSYPSQASRIWGILCACYRRADVDAGRMDTFPQLPFPLLPHQIICGDVSQLEGQSFQTGHPFCVYGTCASELISLPAFVDKI